MKALKTDSQIQADVLAEMKWDSLVSETEVGVQVHHGIVTLTGTVGSWAKRLAARDAAHRVAGVRDVADDLRAKPYAPAKPSDPDIAEAARMALKWHVLIPDERVQTTVADGCITLSGTVDYASQREEAARAVGHLDGVCAVDNQLKLLAVAVSPTQLRSAIEGALERHATREAKKIKLDIEGGKVTVMGEVESFAERLAVVGAVWGTRGVDTVIDQTRVG